MLRRLLLIVGTIAILLPLGGGCNTREPVMWSWPHHKRRFQTIMDGFHEFHMDVDRVFFDMEPYPLEADY